jgi:hypothetical protein
MRELSPILFFIGYLLGGWGVIWLLVMVLGKSDVKFSEAVGFYYGLWILFYLPIAIMGAIALARMSVGERLSLVVTLLSLLAVLVAMFVSFHQDVDIGVLLFENLVFGAIFWFLAKLKVSKRYRIG